MHEWDQCRGKILGLYEVFVLVGVVTAAGSDIRMRNKKKERVRRGKKGMNEWEKGTRRYWSFTRCLVEVGVVMVKVVCGKGSGGGGGVGG